MPLNKGSARWEPRSPGLTGFRSCRHSESGSSWDPRQLFFWVLCFSALLLQGCQRAAPDPLVVVFAVDGAAPWIVDDLRSQGQLPAIQGIIESGVYGSLLSVESVRLSTRQAKRGLISPAIWTSAATGMVPKKHGILDFVLPKAGSSFVWAGNDRGPAVANLSLGGLSGPPPLELRLRIRAHHRLHGQVVKVSFNGQELWTGELGSQWRDLRLLLPKESPRPAHNRVVLRFQKQYVPAGEELKREKRTLAGALAGITVVDGENKEILAFDPVLDRMDLGRGFYRPEAEFVDAQSTHWKAPPVWTLLGNQGHKVGIIGSWGTWPAIRVNGFLVSSYMGLTGLRKKGILPRLTWPEELRQDLLELTPKEAEIDEILAGLLPGKCRPTAEDRLAAFRSVVWQDEFYFRIAQKLLTGKKSGLFWVYFEATDVAAHDFLAFRAGHRLPPGCPESTRTIVDRVYRQTDRRIRRLLEILPGNATILLLSDHGLIARGGMGGHTEEGIFAAAGPNIRLGIELHGASILDVAPTLLHLFGEPIPLAMDGHVLTRIFHPDWLTSHQPRYTAQEVRNKVEAPVENEANDELMERLEGIGYMD